MTLIQKVQEIVDGKGIKDIKFVFTPELKSLALSDAKDLVSYSLLHPLLNTSKVNYCTKGL